LLVLASRALVCLKKGKQKNDERRKRKALKVASSPPPSLLLLFLCPTIELTCVLYCNFALIFFFGQSTTRDLETPPKPTGSGGSTGFDLGNLSNVQSTAADSSSAGSPTSSAGGAMASSPTSVHPSRDLLQEVLSRPGPYPMVRDELVFFSATLLHPLLNFLLLLPALLLLQLRGGTLNSTNTNWHCLLFFVSRPVSFVYLFRWCCQRWEVTG